MAAQSAQSVSSEPPLGPKLPMRLGRFTLCEELGSGGMATVYLSRMDLAAGLDRLVALKTIHPHLAKEQPFVDMFLDEARIASHVSHPNVCAVHDFGEAGGMYYLAMEHLIGEPLFDVINRLVDRFDEVKEVLPFLAARVIADACEGIHAAHTARGPDGRALHIVHRDVSPQNLFVTYDGAVKVVDFGCAKAAQRVAHTSTGVMKGKVGYAAPEQLRNKEVDGRADVWALGVCLWESLTLSPLFTRDTAVATAMSVLDDAVPLASEDRPWVPEAVARIAERALTRDPAERFQSARDMGRELRKFIADCGYTLEAAELAEWMDFLFEDRHQARERQAARVRELDVSNAALVISELVGEQASAEDVEMLRDSMPAIDAVVLSSEEHDAAPEPQIEAQPPPLAPAPLVEPEELERVIEPVVEAEQPKAEQPKAEQPKAEQPRGRGRTYLVAAIVIVALAVGGYYLNLYYEPAPWVLELIRGVPASDAPEEPQTPERIEGTDPNAVDDGEQPGSVEATRAANEATPQQPAPDPHPVERARGEGANSAGSVTLLESGPPSAPPPFQVVDAPPPSQPSPSQPEPSAPTPSPSAGGTVNITASSGWAEILLGGRRLGRTPFSGELPVGRHRLRILPYGQEVGSTAITVDVEAGIDQSHTVDLGAAPPPL